MSNEIIWEEVQDVQNKINGILLYLTYVKNAMDGRTPIQPLPNSSVLQSTLDELIELAAQFNRLQTDYLAQRLDSTREAV